MKNCAFKALACAAALQLTGCFVVTEDDGVPLGTLTVEWSIDGLHDPADCAVFGVDRLELVVFTGSGRVVQEIEPLCESFVASIDLVDGLYYADATLVDSFDRAATTTHTIDAIDIFEGEELIVSIDFPLDSFL